MDVGRLTEYGDSPVNDDGGMLQRGRRMEGVCRAVSERMARIGCGTTEADDGLDLG